MARHVTASRLLCLIPARGGSRGIIGKNLRLVDGISLVARAIRCAQEFASSCGSATCEIIVDTDAADIATEARLWGAEVPFYRSPRFASDEASTVSSTLEILSRLESTGRRYDAVILLQPTSPLRTGADIAQCWHTATTMAEPNVVAITPVQHAPDMALRVADDATVHWMSAGGAPKRRQDYAAAFVPTGSVYIVTPGALRDHAAFIVAGLTRGVELSRERSFDVDSELDLVLVDALPRPVAPCVIGSVAVGPANPCFVIAEAGVNHNGDLALAHALVVAAANAGADAVKFQTFDPALLAADGAEKAAYQLEHTDRSESQQQMLMRLALPHSAFAELAAHARELGIVFLSTAFDEQSADYIESLGVPAFKIPSGEITNHKLIAHVASKQRPVLLSTGMATMREVAAAVDVVRSVSDAVPLLFHCVTEYPAAPADCNLAAMRTMRRAFGVATGWSDHTAGRAISLAAVAMGADIIEKHFTMDRNLPGPDHAASLEPAELAQLIGEIRAVRAAHGDGEKRPAPGEAANMAVARRSLHAARTLHVGDVVAAGDLIALRPGTGVPPYEAPLLIGKRVRTTVAEGHLIRRDDLE